MRAKKMRKLRTPARSGPFFCESRTSIVHGVRVNRMPGLSTTSHGHGVTVKISGLIAIPPLVSMPTGPVFEPDDTVAVT